MEIKIIIDDKKMFLIDLPKGYFGMVQLQFVNEEMVLVRKEESLKPHAVLVA